MLQRTTSDKGGRGEEARLAESQGLQGSVSGWWGARVAVGTEAGLLGESSRVESSVVEGIAESWSIVESLELSGSFSMMGLVVALRIA